MSLMQLFYGAWVFQQPFQSTCTIMGASFSNGYSIDAFEMAFVVTFPFILAGLLAFLFPATFVQKLDYVEWAGALASFLLLLQWMIHSPFEYWPAWVSTKSEDDVRHRTEYYDTGVQVFVVFIGLFFRRHPSAKTAKTSLK